MDKIVLTKIPPYPKGVTIPNDAVTRYLYLCLSIRDGANHNLFKSWQKNMDNKLNRDYREVLDRVLALWILVAELGQTYGFVEVINNETSM